MFFKSKKTEMQKNTTASDLRHAERVSNFAIQFLNNEYANLRHFLDQNALPKAVLNLLNTDDLEDLESARRRVKTAYTDVAARIDAFREHILSLDSNLDSISNSNHFKKYLNTLATAINTDNPDYEIVADAYQHLIYTAAAQACNQQVQTMNKNYIRVSHDNQETIERRPCAIM